VAKRAKKILNSTLYASYTILNSQWRRSRGDRGGFESDTNRCEEEIWDLARPYSYLLSSFLNWYCFFNLWTSSKKRCWL
jgi:hypothetical protein